ncbi:hypothetical protein LCGC14_2784840, partial [marine sediment metagenome]
QKKEPGSQYEWQKGGESLNDIMEKLGIEAEFREEEHPRASDGKFGSGGGVAKKTTKTKSTGPSYSVIWNPADKKLRRDLLYQAKVVGYCEVLSQIMETAQGLHYSIDCVEGRT